MDAWLESLVASKQAAGFVTLVARRGKVIHHSAHGTRGMSLADPMPKDALFDLASMTKPVTVTAALMLLEEGRITLHEPVSKHIPEFKDTRVETAPGTLAPPARPIQVRDLFSHTSGVYTRRSRSQIYELPTLEAFVLELARGPLRAQPGATWLYGSSHDVLGHLVQKVSGQPLDRFIQDRILTPLQMRDTHYWPPDSTASRRALLVVNGKDDPTGESRQPLSAVRAKTYIGGASGLYSTAADYWRFSQMLLDGGRANGHQLLGPRTIAWMAQNHIGDIPTFRTPGTRFGLGFAVVTDPAASGLPYSKGTYYWGGSQGTVFWIDPKEQLIGVLMVQLTPNPLQLREKFAALVYSSLLD
ncbi:MAG: beta-lactamase family protein [Bryobacterales bacterium]|nr:beta-lactamase family protein [Bryobacterales bacterium]